MVVEGMIQSEKPVESRNFFLSVIWINILSYSKILNYFSISKQDIGVAPTLMSLFEYENPELESRASFNFCNTKT